MFEHNVKWWGIEHVQLHDPKQPEGVPYDAKVYTLLKLTGYFDQLARQQYQEQFKAVFQKHIVDFAMDKVKQEIEPLYTPEVVEIVNRFDTHVSVQCGNIIFTVVIRHDYLEDHRFADMLRGEIYQRVYSDSYQAKISDVMEGLSEQQKEYILEVVYGDLYPYSIKTQRPDYRQLVEDGLLTFENTLTNMGWEVFRRLDSEN